jgi:hypothetical protein
MKAKNLLLAVASSLTLVFSVGPIHAAGVRATSANDTCAHCGVPSPRPSEQASTTAPPSNVYGFPSNDPLIQQLIRNRTEQSSPQDWWGPFGPTALPIGQTGGVGLPIPLLKDAPPVYDRQEPNKPARLVLPPDDDASPARLPDHFGGR